MERIEEKNTSNPSITKEKNMGNSLELSKTSAVLAYTDTEKMMEVAPASSNIVWRMKFDDGRIAEVPEVVIHSHVGTVLDVIKAKFSEMGSPSGYRWALYRLHSVIESDHPGFSPEKASFFFSMAVDLVSPPVFDYTAAEDAFDRISRRWKLNAERDSGFDRTGAIEDLMDDLNSTEYASPVTIKKAISILAADREVTFRPSPDRISDACREASRNLLRSARESHPLRQMYSAIYDIQTHICMRTHDWSWTIGGAHRTTGTEDDLDSMFESFGQSNGGQIAIES